MEGRSQELSREKVKESEGGGEKNKEREWDERDLVTWKKKKKRNITETYSRKKRRKAEIEGRR